MASVSTWSGIRNKLEQDYLCPALRGHIQIIASFSPMRLCGPRLGREPHGGGIGCSCGKPYPGKKQYDTWDDEDKAGYQLYL